LNLQLLARVLGHPNPLLWISKNQGANSGNTWEKSPTTGQFLLIGFITPPPGGPRWPWGFNVEPD